MFVEPAVGAPPVPAAFKADRPRGCTLERPRRHDALSLGWRRLFGRGSKYAVKL